MTETQLLSTKKLAAVAAVATTTSATAMWEYFIEEDSCGANDALAPGDPNVYKIVDGKLYLNFSESVAERWNKDIPGFIEKADVNYPTHSPDEHYTTN